MSSFVQIPHDSDFPFNNLPYGVFSTKSNPQKHICVAIGDQVLDLYLVADFYPTTVQNALKSESLNELMGLGCEIWDLVRTKTIKLLSSGSELENNLKLVKEALIAQSKCHMHLPCKIGDYTDFYSSIHHATNVGTLFRSKENPLMPNWKHIPIAYHGRASSVVASGTPIHRPYGQLLPEGSTVPIFAPCQQLDFEMEMAVYIGGQENKLGQRITVEQARKHIFGFSLMNDWSARDIQKWEYIPLGPFTAKNLGTIVSPWIVTLAALEPFIVPNYPQDVTVLPYLKHDQQFNFDVNLEVGLKPENKSETKICQTNYKYMYWTPLQHIAHHTVTGCNIRPGDIMGSGTISGETEDSFGSMLELSWKGTKSIQLKDGESRKYVEDGDEIIMRGYAKKNGLRIGFGECRSLVLPAIPFH